MITKQTSNQPLTILAIESSCDETACAVVQKFENEEYARILTSVTATSLNKHKATKGIVPEVAAREQLKFILPVIEEALQTSGFSAQTSDKKKKLTTHNVQPTTKIDAIAVTTGPGLVGSLLVGIETARALAMAWKLPIIPVNHILAHPYANFIKEERQILDLDSTNRVKDDGETLQPTTYNLLPQFPLLSWVISGGHTELHFMRSHEDVVKLGYTVDDAAGECFDKCARVLGYDYPGGPFIEQLATQYHSLSAKEKDLKPELPRPLVHEKSFNVSFSGLKTAFLRTYNENKSYVEEDVLKKLLAYELQEAITDIIMKKTKLALSRHPETKSIIVSGGVAANKRLKEKFESQLSQLSVKSVTSVGQSNNSEGTDLTELTGLTNEPSLHFPSLTLCTDNAAMIGAYAAFHAKTATDWSKIKLEL